MLKHGRVHHIEVASRSLPGLADKWIVHFTNGMRASAKPMEVDAWVTKEWDLLNMTESLYRTVRPHRADRKMQVRVMCSEHWARYAVCVRLTLRARGGMKWWHSMLIALWGCTASRR